MLELFAQVEEAAAAISARWQRQPRVGIILGTGLGEFAAEIDAEASLDYE